jgi:RNA polymerase sigma-70 factor (ECF subfamily)
VVEFGGLVKKDSVLRQPIGRSRPLVSMRVRRDVMTSTTAFAAFFRESSPRALAVAYRITSNRQDAEDVVIESFARAYARWGRLEHAKWREGWVMTVSSNLALHTVRRKHLEGPESPFETQTGDPAAGVVDRLSLVEALKLLPLRQRQVAVLIYGAGMSHGEAAERLGISTGATKTHLHRAIRRLRTSMSSNRNEGDDQWK